VKILWNAFAAFVLFNLLVVAGFVGFKYSQGYIDKDRIQQAGDVFSLTIDEEAAVEAEVQKLAEQTQQELEQQARLESTGEGSITTRDRLDREKQADEVAHAKLQFFNDQHKALREEMARFKDDHAQRVAQLDKERKAFEDWVQQRAEQTEDANFQQVVSLYEKQPAKQTKQAFQTLMQSGETDQVVEYLAAMSSRKAGQVLAQFKSPVEVAQAADLLEKLRTRGEYTMDPQTSPSGNQS
jgi:flagellar motility protein MotE (MotC chaperone)